MDMKTPLSQVGAVKGCWGLVEGGVFRNGILSEILEHLSEILEHLPLKTNHLRREKILTWRWRDLEDSHTTSDQA